MNVRLIIPNCNHHTSPLVAYGRSIAYIAGGFTSIQATGGWIDTSGSLVVEPVTVFDCSIPSKTAWTSQADYIASAIHAFRTLAKRVAIELSQDCVYLAIDGKVEFITKG